MKLKRIGIDLAKSVFQLHGVDHREKAVLKKRLSRSQLQQFIATLEPTLIGMESCGTAHYWARECRKHGHTVRLIAPQFVKPYVKGNKNDANDAGAICEAMSRPDMRFVEVKTVEQQSLQAQQRVRSRQINDQFAHSECPGKFESLSKQLIRPCLFYRLLLGAIIRQQVELCKPPAKFAPSWLVGLC